MDPVLLDILLDRVTKYLTGSRQTKYIVGSSRQQQPDYWDRIHQATGQQEKKKQAKNMIICNSKEIRK